MPAHPPEVSTPSPPQPSPSQAPPPPPPPPTSPPPPPIAPAPTTAPPLEPFVPQTPPAQINVEQDTKGKRRSRGGRGGRGARVGRPPNINENCLMRRLECVMAVESGRMNMLAACQQYDISARTFYRWLRDKHRLIELTGFTEDDFAVGLSQTDADANETDGDNLPRLSNTSVAKKVEEGGMGLKRRFPKSENKEAKTWQQQAVCLARRSFTKMPSRGNDVEKITAVRLSTRMRRADGEQEDPVANSHEDEPDPKRRKLSDDPADSLEIDDATAQPPLVVNDSGSGKHRLEITSPKKTASVAWYKGANVADIKTVIARIFSLEPSSQWGLTDAEEDEIVISEHMPSGKYTLNVYT